MMQPSCISTKALTPFAGSVILKSGLLISQDFNTIPNLFSILLRFEFAVLTWHPNILDTSAIDGFLFHNAINSWSEHILAGISLLSVDIHHTIHRMRLVQKKKKHRHQIQAVM
jgi:hypothetical protein